MAFRVHGSFVHSALESPQTLFRQLVNGFKWILFTTIPSRALSASFNGKMPSGEPCGYVGEKHFSNVEAHF